MIEDGIFFDAESNGFDITYQVINNYSVCGLEIDNYFTYLQIKKGLSSFELAKMSILPLKIVKLIAEC